MSKVKAEAPGAARRTKNSGRWRARAYGVTHVRLLGRGHDGGHGGPIMEADAE
jgi:hypothetical protein